MPTSECCANCRFWKNVPETEPGENMGVCRVTAPRIHVKLHGQNYRGNPLAHLDVLTRGLWPRTAAGESCGKWEG